MSKNKKSDEKGVRFKLSKEENEIVKSFMFVYGGNKKEAIKLLIRKYLEYDQDVKTAFRLKKEVK